MGRPSEYGPRTAVAVRLRTDVLERLDAIARDRMLSRTWLVDRAVEQLVEQLEAEQ